MKYNSTMSSLAKGNVMAAAARNYQKEMMDKDAKANQRQRVQEVDLEDLQDDPELEQIQRDRIEALKAEQEKRAEMHQKGHGSLTEIQESNFLEEVTGTSLCCVHFYHHEFERCRILDKHLAVLAPQYFETKFVKIHAPDAPFFCLKLKVQVLPCVIMFRNGVAFDRLVGFEELGFGKDDFKTAHLEMRLGVTGILKKKAKTEEDQSDEDEEEEQRNVRKVRVGQSQLQLDSDDESSDFDD